MPDHPSHLAFVLSPDLSCFLLSPRVLISQEKQFKQPQPFTQVYSGELPRRALHGPCTQASPQSQETQPFFVLLQDRKGR